MKIVYNENPLATVVYLTEEEKKELLYKIRVEQLKRRLFSAHFHLAREENERALEELDPERYLEDDSPFEERINLIFEEFANSLEGFHCGDCRCVACSCDKCWAEDLMGINTIEGLRKHEAHHIWSSFGISKKSNWEPTRTIDEVIERLENYNETADWDEDGTHAKRWKKEAKRAGKWLKKYKNKHGF